MSEEIAWAVKVTGGATTGWVGIEDLVTEWHDRALFGKDIAINCAKAWRKDGFQARLVRVCRKSQYDLETENLFRHMDEGEIMGRGVNQGRKEGRLAALEEAERVCASVIKRNDENNNRYDEFDDDERYEEGATDCADAIAALKEAK